ncbi:MAG: hypothetical protein DMD96_12320 [Candidatus Rokuibacteriota bacterium]|nr:MAG: hypothetical protein DMD96_12320 [Candidatus Rokubacteria bacterium]
MPAVRGRRRPISAATGGLRDLPIGERRARRGEPSGCVATAAHERARRGLRVRTGSISHRGTIIRQRRHHITMPLSMLIDWPVLSAGLLFVLGKDARFRRP